MTPAISSLLQSATLAALAADNSMMTWRLSAEDDKHVMLTTSFPTSEIRAVRMVWRDVGLDTPKGVKPGPFRYRAEAETASDSWDEAW